MPPAHACHSCGSRHLSSPAASFIASAFPLHGRQMRSLSARATSSAARAHGFQRADRGGARRERPQPRETLAPGKAGEKNLHQRRHPPPAAVQRTTRPELRHPQQTNEAKLFPAARRGGRRRRRAAVACARRCYSGTQQWVRIMARRASGASLLVGDECRPAPLRPAPPASLRAVAQAQAGIDNLRSTVREAPVRSIFRPSLFFYL